MSYVDLAVGMGIFILFLAIVLLVTITHFTAVPAQITIAEFREKATDLFEKLFSSEGTPSNWEETGEAPSELGLVTTMYRIPITVKERGVGNRQNEPVILDVSFDEECASKAWNDTIRLYDVSLNATSFDLWDEDFCSSQYLNRSYITFMLNISQNQLKRFYLYYSEDDGIPSPNYNLTYNAGNWSPSDGDSWTESTSSWSRYGGESGSVELNSTDKIVGDSSVQIKGTFNSSSLGLEYNPASNITGVSNGWYVDAWLYVDDLTSLSSVSVALSDNSETIYANVSGGMQDGKWYHLEKELASSEWQNWVSFDASNGIDFIRFYMTNATSGLTRLMKVDQLHFELQPLQVKVFPEQELTVVSRKKVSALGNLTYDELREVLGEDYQFRIEITGD